MKLRSGLVTLAGRLKKTRPVSAAGGQLVRSRRKYPVQRDEDGLSLRQQAFAFFGKGCSPSQVYKEKLPGAKPDTILRYFEDWKRKWKRPSYRLLREIMKDNKHFSEVMIERLAETLSMDKVEVILRMQKPWGLLQLLEGRFPNPKVEGARTQIERRLVAALKLIRTSEVMKLDPTSYAEAMVELPRLGEGMSLTISRENGKLVFKKTKA